MTRKMKDIHRVITGSDSQGKSVVTWEGSAPGKHESHFPGRGHTDFWVWRETPQPLNGKEDAGMWHDEFPGPRPGGHLRVVHWLSKGDDPSKVPPIVAPHPPKVGAVAGNTQVVDGRSWDRGGGNNYCISDNHKTESVDFGIVLEGERIIVLDDYETAILPGDIVVQVGAWHLWDSSRIGCLMAFDMVSARFHDDGKGLQQGNDPVMLPNPNQKLPAGVKPQRRIVTIDKVEGLSTLVTDSFSPDVRTDPARPGFAMQRVWVIDGHPAPIVSETLHLPYLLIPPVKGAVLNSYTIPTDSTWRGKVGVNEAKAYYASLNASSIATCGSMKDYPYSQKSKTVEFVIVTEGEITLVLDQTETHLTAGEIGVIRGGNYAWSNRSDKPAVVVVATHDATD